MGDGVSLEGVGVDAVRVGVAAAGDGRGVALLAGRGVKVGDGAGDRAVGVA